MSVGVALTSPPTREVNLAIASTYATLATPFLAKWGIDKAHKDAEKKLNQ